MVGVVKNDISRFLGKLEKVKNLDKNGIAKTIGEFGEETAKHFYNIIPEEKSSIIVGSIISKNEVKIFSEGFQVFYLEYGTGERGRRSNYSGNLNFDINFYSSKLKKNVYLRKWTYSYANKLTKRYRNPIPKVEGHRAYAQMFNTAQEIKRVFRAKRRS